MVHSSRERSEAYSANSRSQSEVVTATTRTLPRARLPLNIDGPHLVDRSVEFTEYVAARGPALERFAYVLTGDPHLAQDLTQTALLKAYRRWRWVARAEHPDAYVRRIVTTSFLDWRRRRSSREAPVGVLPEPDPGGDPADRVADRDQLHRALATLTSRQRAVLVLRHYEGLDDAAIAGLLRCGEASVRSHASRGLQRLRASLDPTTLPGGTP